MPGAGIQESTTNSWVSGFLNYHGSNRAGASVIASPAQDVVLASDMIYKRKRGLFKPFEVPEHVVTFGLARLNTGDSRTLFTVEYANVVSFGQVCEKRDR